MKVVTEGRSCCDYLKKFYFFLWGTDLYSEGPRIRSRSEISSCTYLGSDPMNKDPTHRVTSSGSEIQYPVLPGNRLMEPFHSGAKKKIDYKGKN